MLHSPKSYPQLYLFFSFLLALTPFSLSAQSQEIRNLESEAHNASGTDRIEKFLRLSELFLNEGFEDEAFDMAEIAEKGAKSAKQLKYQVLAVNRMARATYEKGGFFNRRKGDRLLRESFSLLPLGSYPEAQLETLELLLASAERRNDKTEIQEFSNAIERLKRGESGITILPSQSGSASSRPL